MKSKAQIKSMVRRLENNKNWKAPNKYSDERFKYDGLELLQISYEQDDQEPAVKALKWALGEVGK